jgi:hypothetical protein
MAMRLRKTGQFWKALCAAETEALPGDVYLDDAQDRAIRLKIEADWNSEGCGPADADRLRKEAKPLRRVVNMLRIVERPDATAPNQRLIALFIRERVCLLVGKDTSSMFSEADVNEVAEALAACEEKQTDFT